MNTIFKNSVFAVAIVAAGWGGIKAYDAYSVKSNSLMVANVEALSNNGGDYYTLVKSAHPIQSTRGCVTYIGGYGLVSGGESDCIHDNNNHDCIKNICMVAVH